MRTTNTIRNLILRGVLLTALAGLSSCAHIPTLEEQGYGVDPSRDPARAVDRGRIRAPGEIAPGNDILLSCTEDPSLNGKYRVEFEGILKLPYKVQIETAGLTKDTLQDKLADAYSRFYKSPPTISVTVLAEKIWVEAGGLVEKSGRFLVKPTTSLDEIIALAGGLQKNTPPRYVRVQQGTRATVISLTDYYAGSPDAKIPAWEGGDVVFLQSDRGDTGSASPDGDGFIQIMGEVRIPGEYRFVKGADLYFYIAKAGGPTTSSDLSRIDVIRGPGKGKAIGRYDFSSPRSLPNIVAGDMIVVPPDRPTTLEKTVPIVAGLVGILNTVLLLILLH